jgi:hypothetical protein
VPSTRSLAWLQRGCGTAGSLIYNGYGAQVADLYKGLEKERLFV